MVRLSHDNHKHVEYNLADVPLHRDGNFWDGRWGNSVDQGYEDGGDVRLSSVRDYSTGGISDQLCLIDPSRGAFM